MESNTCPDSKEERSPQQLPSLFNTISSEVVFGFDTIPSPGSDLTIVNVSYHFDTVSVNMFSIVYCQGLMSAMILITLNLYVSNCLKHILFHMSLFQQFSSILLPNLAVLNVVFYQIIYIHCLQPHIILER